MKTISGHCVSLKEISLSKAAKILSKFVSADNGASHVIGAYLHRASVSFNELDQLHKELKSSHSQKKHKSRTVETGDESGREVENYSRSVEANQELSHGNVKSDKFRRQQIGDENADEDGEKSAQTVGGSEKHKKNKKKQQEVESRHDGGNGVKFGEREGDGKLPNGTYNEIESGQEQGNVGDGNHGMEEGKKQRKEKKKHKEGASNFSSNKGGVENPECENTKGQQLKEMEKKLCNNVEGENGGLVGSLDFQVKKRKNDEEGSEKKSYSEEVKTEQRKKRKSEDVERTPEERSRDLSKKKVKRKHE
ncbi:vicilin-like seed storage protein At2g18540 isoform X1 [Abrus precatorius]|uniref:Vicilin-like seed storage protein At2g18540 isoform X1 n=1 Tax=Abrus precatorius TaxID=3816 RepID=A0A8B8JPK5_ABRPR|nr:vicilin-like seed storage protein At2g18540 isoform X1 [Abrus precatorius]